MPRKLELLQEAKRRGILPENKRALYQEAVRRGLIGAPKDEPPPEQTRESTIQNVSEGALKTIQNVGQVYPLAETAAQIGTASYGAPLAGLAGLFALPFGLEKAEKVVKGVQNALIYQPQTKRGQELTEALAYPLERLDKLGGAISKPIEKAGYPNVAAGVHSAVAGAPMIMIGGKIFRVKSGSSPRVQIAIDKQLSKAIETGINKSIRPAVAGKQTRGQVVKYHNKARTAVKEIIKNKDELNLVDQSGARIEGLPKTLDQFSQAIEQTKKNIFKEYDTLAQKTGNKGVKIDLISMEKDLNQVIKNKVLNDLSPETIQYAEHRLNALTERGFYTAAETQEAIQLLNQTLEKFYKDPSPAMKGQAFIDAMIANKLRQSLDTAINKTTGKNYQALKNKYGAIRSIERDVTRRSIVDARKNMKGLIDFSDVYTGYHITKGILAMEPSTAVAGIGAKLIAQYMKLKNNPNRIVKGMFLDAEKLMLKRELSKY